MASGYLKNNEGNFEFVPFPEALQVAPITAFVREDFNGNGKEEVLTAGNYFGVKPYHGRFDAFPGALIQDEDTIILGSSLGLDLTQKSVRHLAILTLNDQKHLLVVYNNAPAEVYTINAK